ncbi:related to Syntaxin PEP12 [Zygosaccharomyces bailii ISA1307]|nr:related to Syntaxin PEP12 [Zygosaccharomyces bailii ISA1307]
MDEFFGDDLNEDAPPRFSDSPEFETLKENIAALLFEINGQISTLQQFISTLHSLLDRNVTNTKVVENIDKKSINNIRKVGGLIKGLNEVVIKVDAIDENELDKTQIIAREKLVRDARYSLQEFQSTQRQYATVIKDINARAKAAFDQEEEQKQHNEVALLDEAENGTSAQMVVEREPINNEEFAYQQHLIQQRDQEISSIENGITELNEIFKDLGAVVQQQGLMVDNIEANIYTASDNTQMASQELDKALRSQKHSSKWCLYLLIALSCMLFMLLLVVFV